MTTTTKKKSFEKTIIHSIVIAVIILGFGHLPTFSTVTPYGMKALGCFIAIIYGWLFAGMLITSILAFILIPFTGLVTANGLLIAGFGNIVTLQVLFVLMLPGLIFGGLTNAFSPSDPEIPILNSETAIIENANEITFTLNGILGEALDDVLARIEADFAASGADHMEVKNAYSGGPIYNANLFISQYCAAKDKDFESISLNDLAATLRENKQHLYSYTSKQEIRESTVTDRSGDWGRNNRARNMDGLYCPLQR